MKLDQVLHGYADGHRQLAGSQTLKPRDIKTMLVMSDLSGSGASVDDAGYLTGYPLVESGVYALARTWPAPEMPRPGCVWTHTILVDFADLAVLTSLASLLALFKKPHGSPFGEYGDVLVLGNDSNDDAIPDSAHAWSRRVLAGLYGSPRNRVIALRPVGEDADRITLSLWSQQWPRLRRSFRFCTLAVADRSSDGSNFDLQLLPSTDRSVRTRFPDAIDVESTDSTAGSWLDDAVVDLARPDVSGLRSFLRRIGADVATGRQAFLPLCRLHRLVDSFSSRPESVNDAIALLQEELGSVQARAARAIVAGAALDQADELDEAALEFLLEHLDLIDSNILTNRAERIGRAVWNRNPGRLIGLLGEEGALSGVPERALGSLSVTELANGLSRVPALSQAALKYRPDLVAEPSVWSRELVDIDDAFTVIGGSSMLRSPALVAMIAAERDDLAARAVRELGSLAVLQVVGSEFEQDRGRRGLDRWISASASVPTEVAQYLGMGPARPRTLLVAIARALSPDAVPNVSGADPWLAAHQSAIGSVSNEDALYLSAYFLSRAFGSVSCDAAELAEAGFDSLHVAVASNRLPDEAWRLLDHRLPSSLFWFGADRCRRIRAGVAELFIERDLEPHVFARLTMDDRLFMEMAVVSARSSAGRKYLKRVLSDMEETSENKFFARIRDLGYLLRFQR